MDKVGIKAISNRYDDALTINSYGCGTHEAMAWFKHYINDIRDLLSHIEALEKQNMALELRFREVADIKACHSCANMPCGGGRCDFVFDYAQFSKEE